MSADGHAVGSADLAGTVGQRGRCYAAAPSGAAERHPPAPAWLVPTLRSPCWRAGCVMPLMPVRFDALPSRFLGSRAGQLRVIFAEMPRRPDVYLFDAVAKARGDSQSVHEMNRVITAFL